MTEEDDETATYDPASPTPPLRAPPLRSTAPQSPFTSRQVGIGFVVLVIGIILTFGLPLLL
ncbi:MAG: hypothetical protein ABEH64_13530 [Salinirussus sp.]